MQIQNFPNYTISENGNVENIKTQRVLKLKKEKNGYWRVNLCNAIGKKDFYIHRLVALHFIENPLNLEMVDHINHDKSNNTISNLRWVTRSQNNQNSVKNKNSNSIYKGVYKSGNNWQVKIRIDGRQMSFGTYKSENEAALVYNEHCSDFHVKNVIS